MRNGITSRIVSPEVLAFDAAIAHSSGPITFAELPLAEEAKPDPYYSLRNLNLPRQQALLVVTCPDDKKRLCGEQVANAMPRGARIVPVGGDGYAILAQKEELVAMIEQAKAKQAASRVVG